VLRSLARAALGLAAPPRCAGCGSPGSLGGGLLCASCDEALRDRRAQCAIPGPPGLDAAIAAHPFEGIARALVHELKFRRRLGVAVPAGGAMAAAAGRLLDPDDRGPGQGSPEAVVPVPPDPLRWAWRGFDPAEELALVLARELGLPLRHCLRRRPGPRQVGRKRADRLAAPPAVRPRGACPGSVLLVDDVWTTGATLSACAWALRGAGCERVVAAVFARAVPLSRGPGRGTIALAPEGRRPGP
jgi:predicted amidophosphoribosyltransferase